MFDSEDFGYARMTLASEDQARMVLNLHGITFDEHELQIQLWESKFRHPCLLPPATTAIAKPLPFSHANLTSDLMSDPSYTVGSAVVAGIGQHFKVKREDCAILVRNIPSGITADDLKHFLQKRIQLAFKELMSDI
ncbi:hypothetical protein IV203_002910 [Nitzschia inconspicua]|uniref:Uncharacterized protein n=1 Tax=Nitzschia inconspicua TaxID=303405 RepID=A0A9K3L0W5_9STRA|nr:hypothetical protein IV203_002910 [Nitzschia inconspicua]